MKITLLSAFGGALLVCGLVAGAANASPAATSLNATLKGSYPYNETIIGVTAPATGPVCPQTLPPGSVSTQLSITDQGIWTFDGLGNMSATNTGVLTAMPGTGEAADVSASAASCGGTYAVNANHTVDMAYVCGLAGGYVQLVFQSHGLITPYNILVTVPQAAGGGTRVLSEYVGGVLAACAVLGENANLMRATGTGYHWPAPLSAAN